MSTPLHDTLEGLLAKATPLLEASEARASVPHTSHGGRRVVGFKIVDGPDHFLTETLDQLEALELIARALPDLLSTLSHQEAEIAGLQSQVEELRGALAPFARIAGPIHEGEAWTYLDAISGPNGTDELKLSTYVGDGTRIEILDADDFRRARQALERSNRI